MRYNASPRQTVNALLCAAVCSLACTAAAAQPAGAKGGGHVEILNADRWEFDRTVAPGAQRLIGHVRFKQDDANMACDSAWLYEDERVTAFGNVRLAQGDSLLITGDKLEYSGSTHQARIAGNVFLSDRSMELTTGELRYNVAARRADYGQGARITSKRDGTLLTSRKGAYFASDRLFVFSDSVRLTDRDRTMAADTLRYHLPGATAEFLGPTTIVQGDVDMYCERGSYDTRAGKGRFTRAARITSGGQVLTGDSLHYDRNTGEGTGWGHVAITDTANKLVVRGEFGKHRQQQARTMVTGRAEMVMAMGADSLYLHADTLFAFQDSLKQKRITARRHVRFFKQDLQGQCDTMTYSEADSTIRLRGTPFIWSGPHQVNGDSMRITLSGGHPDTLVVEGAAFLVTPADSLHFNQITGSTITGRFRDDELVKAVAEGNSRTVYFARETKDSVERTTGMNRADCSRIILELDSGKVSSVSFITQPAATLYPLELAPVEEMRLEGFRWNAAARPEDREAIFREPQ